MIGLHEAEVSYQKNPIRGAQFYPNCIQIEVLGDGDVELPAGVSFPGAYKWEDPGIVYDVSPSVLILAFAPSILITYHRSTVLPRLPRQRLALQPTRSQGRRSGRAPGPRPHQLLSAL